MTQASLFAGIGGPDLAADIIGWENIFHCEWNKFCQSILKEHYPNSIFHDDITKTDFTIYRGKIDVLTGGFPCQPYSAAGKRKGKDDYRHLWPEMLRVIREIQPPWVVGENVRGLTNWNGGLVFDEVQSDLEAAGYEVTPFLLPAAAVNAPHRRDRIWFVAYSISNRNTPSRKSGKFKAQGGEGFKGKGSGRVGCKRVIGLPRLEGDVADTNSIKRCEGRMYERRSEASERYVSTFNARSDEWETWDNFPTQSPVCNGNDGFSTELLRQRIRADSMGLISEKEIDKILSTAYSQWRKETIKAGGNAIVLQVIYQIFKAIQEYEKLNKYIL